MRGWYATTCALAVTLAVASACAQAAVVTVTPENMESLGWSIETNQGGFGALTAWGPAVYEHHGFVTEDGFPLGRGAFYAENTHYGTWKEEVTPSSVWLGLDKVPEGILAGGQTLLEGVTLSSITRMDYYSFVSRIPVRSDSKDWTSHTWYRGPNHPIMLQITAESPDGTDRKQFWYHPWGGEVQGMDGGMDHCGAWQLLNCFYGRWYLAPTLPDSSDEGEWDNWTDLCAVYGDYRLVATSTHNDHPSPDPGRLGHKSAGWYDEYNYLVDPMPPAQPPPAVPWTDPQGCPTCTATGKCINFETGARRYRALLYHNGTDFRNWWPQSVGIRAYVDYFTLGINGNEVTYNFDASPAEPDPVIVAGNMRSFGGALLGNQEPPPNPNGTFNTYIFAGGNLAKTMLMDKVVGKCVNRSGNKFWAEFEDGSALNTFYTGDPPQPYNMSVRMHMVGLGNIGELPNGIYIGSYWTAWGLVERLRGYKYYEIPPLFIWSDPEHVQQVSP